MRYSKESESWLLELGKAVLEAYLSLDRPDKARVSLFDLRLELWHQSEWAQRVSGLPFGIPNRVAFFLDGIAKRMTFIPDEPPTPDLTRP